MTWRIIALAAVVGGSLVFFLYERKKPHFPVCGYRMPNVNSEELAAQMRKMVERQETIEELVERINREAGIPDEKSIDNSTVDDLLFGSFPPVEAAAAKYHSSVAQEHPERILLPENLVDADQRAASRASLLRLRNYLAIYQLSLPEKSQQPFLICGNDRAAVADAMSRRFYRSQIELEKERFDEMEALLDMMDGVLEAAVDGETIVFPTLHQQEDYHRSIYRIRRLEALRTTRERLLEQRLQKKPDSERIKAPPEIWDFLHSSNYLRLDRDQIILNGKSIGLPVERAELVSALGKPREIEGDTGPSVWDHWGIAAFHKPRSTQIDSLILVLRPNPTRSWPIDIVRGRLTLLGVQVDENSTPWSLNRRFSGQKFVGDESGWEWTLALDDYTIKTQFNWDGTIDSLTIDALPPRP